MKIKKFFEDFLYPTSILSGTIIGAGMFSLPFIFQSVGWFRGISYLGVFIIVFFFVHLMYADIIVRTNGNSHFAKFAKIYLGGWTFYPTIFITVGGMILALTAYLALSVSFGNLLGFAGYGAGVAFIFWFLGSLGIFINERKLAVAEFLVTGGIFTIIAYIFAVGVKELFGGGGTPVFSPINFSGSGYALYLLPFGPILFSLAGRTAIPPIINYTKKYHEKVAMLKKIILVGTIAPGITYLFFIIGVFGLSRAGVSMDAISGMAPTPFLSLRVIGFLGLIVLLSTYVVVGRGVRDLLHLDSGMKRSLSGCLAVALPWALYLLGFKNFFSLVSFAGGVFLALESVLIIFIWLSVAKKHPPGLITGKLPAAVIIFFLAIFILGLLYEIFHFFNY